ncbi:hypothetical protein D9M73_297090 [compost metagenome]
MDVGWAHHRLDDFAIEGETLGVAGQADGFQVADFAMEAGQLTVVGDLDLQQLAMLELAELFGLLATGQYFLNSGRR